MRIAIVFLSLFIVAPAIGLAAEASTCEHSGERAVTSPDGRWVATVQEEVCSVGASAAAGVVVDLSLAADATHARRVFSMRVPRSRDQWPRVIWTGPSALELWAPNRAEIGAQLPESEGVRIELKYCGDNPEERAQVAQFQAAFKKWMQDTTAWAEQRKRDPDFKGARPQRPVEPAYSPDSCADVGK
ncbi:MAG: hypothetical protein WDO56_29340 [Gammaproteobacteria bacterium]